LILITSDPKLTNSQIFVEICERQLRHFLVSVEFIITEGEKFLIKGKFVKVGPSRIFGFRFGRVGDEAKKSQMGSVIFSPMNMSN
jgi:hypothetical protein